MDSPDNIFYKGSLAALLRNIFPGGTYMPHVAFLLCVTPYITEAFGEHIKSRFISTVEIGAQDEIYTYVMSWVARTSLSQDNHRLFVSSTIKHEPFSFEGTHTRDDHEADDSLGDVNAETSLDDIRSKISLYNSRPLHWTPGMGTHFFRYENRFLTFTRSMESQESTPWSRRPEKIVISCLGRDATIIKRLIYNARIEYLERERGRTSIYRATKTYGDELGWTKCMSKATRPMYTIALDESIKQGLIKDLQRYLNPRTKRWYANRGVPYRRGYLFSGPPGTGKTSLTLAAAGLMGLDIYMISLNSPRLSEDSLATLFRNLPRTCLVLLEDIDATGLTHKRSRDAAADGPQGGRRREKISLSGLLNVIDGVGAQEGRVLVMTSNHTEDIDPALLRPGRVDFSVKFGLATSDTITQLFTQMYTQTPSEEASRADNEAGIKDSMAVTASSLNSVAIEFSDKVPELLFSPAAIQGYLLTHQDDPRGAVGAVDNWVQQQRESITRDQQDVNQQDESTGSVEEDSDSETDSSKNDN
ncbi:BCS1 N terminal-domain-containing protein [Dactylonectria macrodidyma]|uniref:BCS1 N terminal-domain-containing protein n=1 Tax=Dactylonectria macrodidyma TaxID=307937 RepID=A0A9P9EGP2_9HYPO|nr:BCS1 N terminal-domain-containing protein [Dactylonectria macrodidyma]